MTEHKYSCDTCSYNTNIRQSWYKHKKTKKHIKLNPNEEEIILYNCKYCNYKTYYNNLFYKHKKTKKHILNKNKLEKKFIFTCKNCNFFSDNRKSWHSHLNSKQHLINDDMADTKILDNNEVLEKNNNNFNQNINNITNNITNNINSNNNTNISINFYGHENLNVLDLKTFEKIMKIEKNNPKKALELLLEHIYIKTPENRNVKYSNLESKYVNVLTENGYIKMPKDFVFSYKTDKLINDLPIPNYNDTFYFNNIDNMKDAYYTPINRPIKAEYKKKEKYIREIERFNKNINYKKDYKNIKTDFFNNIYKLETIPE